jgi:hypothetical protein
MANYRAVGNGNWSNLAIWQDDSLGYFANSTVLPTSADDVYSNNFTVTIDGTRNAFTIRNTAFTPPTNLGAMSIPQMSSNTTPSGAAAASSVQGTGVAWRAFDRNTATLWQTLTVNSGWLSYNFPTGKIIKRYGFFTSGTLGRGPRTWTFEGSNDGSTWTTLDTQTNFVTGVSTFFSFDISANTTSYTYYRINVTAVQQLGQVIEITELEMSEITNLYGGTTAGGGFTFANGGDLTCSASNGIEVGSTTPTLLFDLPSGQIATFNGSASNSFSVTNSQNIRSSGSGTFNIVGNLNVFLVGGAVGNRRTLLINGNGTINILGNIDCASNQSNTVSTIDVTSNCTINHTGIITGGAYSVLSVATSVSLRITTQCAYNLTGNVIGSTNAAIGSVSTANINIIGNATGSVSGPAILNTTAPLIIDVLGITTSGSGSPAIQGLATTFVKLRGNIVNIDTYAAIYAGRVVIDNNVTSWQFKDSTNTITRTLYTAGVNLGNPLQSDVRNLVTYGPSLELTGTTFVPSPANTRRGVPVDNTVGTADLTSNDIFYAIETSNIPVAVRLRNISTVETFGTQIASYDT